MRSGLFAVVLLGLLGISLYWVLVFRKSGTISQPKPLALPPATSEEDLDFLPRWNLTTTPYFGLIRVQKSGSKSLNRVLAHTWPGLTGFCSSQTSASCRRYTNCASVTLKPGPRGAVMEPHSDWTDLKRMMGERPAYYATVLRHPVARVVSEYKHVASTAGRTCEWDYTAHSKQPLSTRNCLEYVLNKANERGVCNRQTMLMAGSGPFVDDAEKLSVAVQHLRELDFIGLTERFEDSLDIIKYFLNLDNAQHEQVVEKFDGVAVNITVELEQAILQRNQLDLQLYREAERLFGRQLARIPSQYLHNHQDKSEG